MEFEFDPAKSVSNKDKHGIHFIEAQELWLDAKRLIVPAKYVGEQGFAMIAARHGRLWLAIYVLRGESIRLISVRRTRVMEKERCEDYNRRRIR